MGSNGFFEIVGPALVACLMIALTHAPLGIEVLRRGIIFIDLAIAQLAGLGIVVASTLLHEPSWLLIQSSALAFALIAAFSFRWVERRYPVQQEAIIGCSFVVSASLAMLLLASRPHGSDEIEHLLSGQVLFITWHEIVVHAPIYGCILALWFGAARHVRTSVWFYVLFAVAITSSVQLVGVYVVFASLILPALAAVATKHQVFTAWTCGIASVGAGMFGSTYLDASAGPVIVLSYAVVTLAVLLARQAWSALLPQALRR